MAHPFQYVEPTASSKLFKNIYHLSEVDSTNAFLRRQLRANGIEPKAVVTTAHQTSGRGQMGTSWQAEKGKNLLLSAHLTDVPLDIGQQHLLSMSICLAMNDTLRGYMDETRVKWPNDVVIHGKKLGGTLIENAVQQSWESSILGIGLNINQASFPGDLRATSVFLESSSVSPLHEVRDHLLAKLEERILLLWQGDEASLREEYVTSLEGRDEWRDFLFNDEHIYARIIGVDMRGQLLLELRSGRILRPGLKELKYLWK